MTASNSVVNGSDLDECCSNVFALTDLCGLRWRKFISHKNSCSNPVDDPVLSSFASALSHDILCSWRGIPQANQKLQDKDSCLATVKELWIFWFGDDPNLTGIVAPDLKDTAHGCWEDGLPHEPRSLLFKALHNLLERCLLSKKFIRLGKWFLRPFDDSSSDSSKDLAFSFSFFVHGDSSVCTAVEIKQQHKLKTLTLEDIAVAATRPNGLPVILSPYAVDAVLTGQAYHLDDPNVAKLIAEWGKFYPLDTMPDWCSANLPDQELPAVVVVVVGDVQMCFPSSYVMVPEYDKSSSESGLTAPSTDAQNDVRPSSVSLTPPASPSDPPTTDELPLPKLVPSNFKATPSSDQAVLSLVSKECLGTLSKKKMTQSLVQEVWQEITTLNKSTSRSASKPVSGFVKSEPTGLSGMELSLTGQPLWDFEEPLKRTSCSCTSSSNISRPKPPTQVRSSFGITRPIASPSHPLPSPQQQQSSANVKLKKEREKKKPLIPFHQRPSVERDVPEALRTHVALATKGVPTVNLLTSVNQKRHINVAATGAVNKAKKHNWSNQSPYPRNLHGVGLQQVDSKSNNTNLTSLSSNINSSMKKADVYNNTSASSTSLSNIALKTEGEKIETEAACNELVSLNISSVAKDFKTPYVLPVPGNFALPSLPDDPLDCRSFGQVPPTSTEVPVPSFADHSSPSWEVCVKRPPSESDIDSVPSPAKRVKRESSAKSCASAGRSRADSVGQNRSKGRKNSALQSPAPASVSILSDPFTPQSDESEFDVAPLISLKSPPQGKAKPRRQSSTNMSNSPLPSPASSEQTKPGRTKQRRQSVRKQQQEEKEKERDKHLKEREQQEKSGLQAGLDPVLFPKILPSPPTPRTSVSSFLTAKDLKLTANDLDKLFESDEEDCVADIQTSRGVTQGSHIVNDSHSNMYNTSSVPMGTSLIAQTDLQRMFPTPPSPPASHSPPTSIGSEYVSPGSVKMVPSSMTSPETYTLFHHGGLEAEHKEIPKDLGPVFEVPDMQEFPLSFTFGVVEKLPSLKNSKNKRLPDSCCYKPKLQRPEVIPTVVVQGSNMVQPVDSGLEVAMATPSPFGYTFMEPGSVGSIANSDIKHLQITAAMSPVSPASSVSSFSIHSQLGKTCSISGAITRSKTLISALPEAHALTRILALSDSSLNYFSDSNYSGVTLCICDISGLSKGEYAICKKKGISIKGYDFGKCACGFAQLEAEKFGKGIGLFPEDERELPPHSLSKHRRTSVASVTNCSQQVCPGIKQEPGQGTIELQGGNSKRESLTASLVEVLVDQCSSPFSCCTMEAHISKRAKQASKGFDKMQDDKLAPILAVTHLYALKQILQEALQKSTSRKTWEQPNGTVVQGPLSWKQLHHLASRPVIDEAPKAQPIPHVMVGYDRDWMTLSPFALQFWEKLLLVPYASRRDVAYIVVAPENDSILANCRLFFRELSSVFETCHLGRHVPITKDLNWGILRVSQKAVQRLSKDIVDDWFNQYSHTPEGARLKLYAQVCRSYLAPYLNQQTVDHHLLEGEKSEEKNSLPRFGADSEKGSSDKNGSASRNSTNTARNPGKSAGTPTGENHPGFPGADEDVEQTSDDPPTIVVYVIDPFSSGEALPSSAGMLRCFAEMLPHLSDNIRSSVVLQMIPVDQVLQVDMLSKSRDASCSFVVQLKRLAFSVFSRCRRNLQLNSVGRSLTGFPAALHQPLLKMRERENVQVKLYTSPYILSSPAPQLLDTNEDSQEVLGSAIREPSILYCGYCLSHDQRWLLTVCTDSSGSLMESNAIYIDPPVKLEGRRRKTLSRTKALRKLWDFYCGVTSTSLSPWRLVITKFGRLGEGELRDWKEILSKTSAACEHNTTTACNACRSVQLHLRPCVLGASVVGFEPEPAVRLYMAKGLPRMTSPFDSGHNSRTPVAPVGKPDTSKSYITVFPCSLIARQANRAGETHVEVTADTAAEAVVTDTDILMAGADEDDDSDLQQIFSLLEAPRPLSPTGGMLTSPMTSALDSSSMQTSPIHRPTGLSNSPSVSVHSPFQPITRSSPFQPVSCHTPSPSVSMLPPQGGCQGERVEQSTFLQPLSQGYLMSTVQTGQIPGFLLAHCPQAEKNSPVMLRASLLLHNPNLVEMGNGISLSQHVLSTHSHCDVLRFILYQFDALSWLTFDQVDRDRRSSLPVHLCMLAQLHEAVASFMDSQTNTSSLR